MPVKAPGTRYQLVDPSCSSDYKQNIAGTDVFPEAWRPSPQSRTRTSCDAAG